MREAAKLGIIDLSSPDHLSTANSIRQACIEYGFFYVVNHGVEKDLMRKVFEESKNWFSLPLEEKMKSLHKEHRGYSPLFSQNLDISSSSSKGGLNEGFYIGPLQTFNHWPSDVSEAFPSWRPLMESYYSQVLHVGKRLSSLIALALNLDKDYFEKIGATDEPHAVLRLLHYPVSGEAGNSDEEIVGAAAHSDFGMITLLLTNGVPGLQVCREKFNQTRIWEDVLHVDGALIVNIGDLMERWTNCLFRSTLHRVMPARSQDRYSMAFFFHPNPNCIVQCLETCCSESCPQRFPPIRSGDYIAEQLKRSYGTSKA